MRYALVKNGVVENVIEADGTMQVPADTTAIATSEAGPGWTYADGVFSPPTPPLNSVPELVTLAQARAIMKLRPGKNLGPTLFDEANTIVSTSGNIPLQEFWERGDVFHRNSETLATLATQLGLTNDEVDQLFRDASAITV